MDERELSWWEEALRSLMEGDFVRNDYYHRLCEPLLSLAGQANSVFVGRGADLILPRDRGFRVRLVAPMADRLRRFAATMHLDPARAESEMRRIEQERERFFRHHFGVAPDDPMRYDITINLTRFTLDQSIAMILEARSLLRGGN